MEITYGILRVPIGPFGFSPHMLIKSGLIKKRSTMRDASFGCNMLWLRCSLNIKEQLDIKADQHVRQENIWNEY